jgi:hypothetical protein
MRRLFAAILLVAVLAIGGGLIASAAYQAGIESAIVTAVEAGDTVATPVVVPAYGYGWHLGGPGFGFFGFLTMLFVLFIVFGLIRAIVGGGGPRRSHAWGGWNHEHGRSPWAGMAHDTFDEWHQRAHGETPGDPSGPKPSADNS